MAGIKGEPDIRKEEGFHVNAFKTVLLCWITPVKIAAGGNVRQEICWHFRGTDDQDHPLKVSLQTDGSRRSREIIVNMLFDSIKIHGRQSKIEIRV